MLVQPSMWRREYELRLHDPAGPVVGRLVIRGWTGRMVEGTLDGRRWLLRRVGLFWTGLEVAEASDRIPSLRVVRAFSPRGHIELDGRIYRFRRPGRLRSAHLLVDEADRVVVDTTGRPRGRRVRARVLVAPPAAAEPELELLVVAVAALRQLRNEEAASPAAPAA